MEYLAAKVCSRFKLTYFAAFEDLRQPVSFYEFLCSLMQTVIIPLDLFVLPIKLTIHKIYTVMPIKKV